MGAAASSGGADLRSLAAEEVLAAEEEWSKTSLAAIFDTETPLFPPAAAAAAAAATAGSGLDRGGMGVGSAGVGTDVEPDEQVEDEVADLADATVCLAGQDSREAVRQTMQRLAHDLCVHCRSDDPFAVLLSQRVAMLHMMHVAITNKRRDAAEAAGPGEAAQASLLAQPATVDMPPAVQLALHLLYSLLDFVREESCEPAQRADFLKQVAPMLAELPALCLSHPGEEHIHPRSLLPGEAGSNRDTVLDSLRDFLYLASLPSAYFPNSAGSAERDEVTATLTQADTIEQRTESATALLGLASARGRASDLLLVVKVLLGIGLPQPTRPSAEALQQQQQQQQWQQWQEEQEEQQEEEWGDDDAEQQELFAAKKAPLPIQTSALNRK